MRIAPLLVALSFVAGLVAHAAGEDEKPPKPATVKALRYRLKIVESALEWTHGGGEECDELWFPERKVIANVTTELGADVTSKPVMHAFFADAARNSGVTDTPHAAPRDLPTEEVQVPAALAERIFELAELTARQTKAAHETATASVEAGALRWGTPKAPEPADKPK